VIAVARACARLLVVAALLLAPAAAEAGRTAAAPRRPPRGQAAKKKIVVFVGMPGAGKSTAADRLATRLGVTRLSTGDAIRNTIKQRGLPYNEVTDRAVAEEFARKPGEIARRTVATVRADRNEVSIVEGFRTMADARTFKKAFPQAVIVAVEVGRERRFKRMLARGRKGEDNRPYLLDRDRSETRRGVRDVMRGADMRIRPRGDDYRSLDRSLDRVWKRVSPSDQRKPSAGVTNL
jgi:adenylate kinase family enzyme